jgi:hypothetical protein
MQSSSPPPSSVQPFRRLRDSDASLHGLHGTAPSDAGVARVQSAGQGRAGQRRAGQGRAGQGRAGQGRAASLHRLTHMDTWMDYVVREDIDIDIAHKHII